MSSNWLSGNTERVPSIAENTPGTSQLDTASLSHPNQATAIDLLSVNTPETIPKATPDIIPEKIDKVDRIQLATIDRAGTIQNRADTPSNASKNVQVPEILPGLEIVTRGQFSNTNFAMGPEVSAEKYFSSTHRFLNPIQMQTMLETFQILEPELRHYGINPLEYLGRGFKAKAFLDAVDYISSINATTSSALTKAEIQRSSAALVTLFANDWKQEWVDKMSKRGLSIDQTLSILPVARKEDLKGLKEYLAEHTRVVYPDHSNNHYRNNLEAFKTVARYWTDLSPEQKQLKPASALLAVNLKDLRLFPNGHFDGYDGETKLYSEGHLEIGTERQKIGRLAFKPDHYDKKGVYFLGFSIDEPFQRHGLGNRLITGLEETVPRDITTLYLDVESHNRKGVSFYDKIGFKPVDSNLRLDALDNTAPSILRLFRHIRRG